MRNIVLDRGPEVRRRILLFLVVAVPVLFLRFVNDPINLPKFVLLTIGLLIVGAIRAVELLQGAPRDGLLRVWLPAAAVTLPLSISWIVSPYRGWAVMGEYARLGGLLPYIVCALLAVLVADAFGGRALELARAFVIGAGIVAAYGLLQVASLDPFVWAVHGRETHVASSSLGNTNFVGGFLAMALPISIGLVLLDRERKVVSVVLAVVIAAGCLATFSEGGWAAALGGSSVVVGLVFRRGRRIAVVAGWIAAGAVAAAVAVAVLVAIINPETIGRPTTERRANWWIGAIRMGVSSPVVGRGPNVYAIEGISFRTKDDALVSKTSFTDDPHSVPLAMFANAGTLGFIGFFVVAGWSIARFQKAARESVLTAASLGGVVAYFIQALVSVDTIGLRMGAWTLIGTLAASTVPAPKARSKRSARANRARVPLRAAPAVAGVVVVALLATWFTWRLLVADRAVFVGRTAHSRGEVLVAQREFQHALRIRNDITYRHVYGSLIGGVAVQLGDRGKPFMDEAREAFAFVEDIPDVPALMDFARLLLAWGEVEPDSRTEAAAMFQRALRLDPQDPVVVLETASALRQSGQLDEAERVLSRAIHEVGDHIPAFWGELALARVALRDHAGAREAVDRAFDLQPSQPQAVNALRILERRGEDA